jgi:hypothetical protein
MLFAALYKPRDSITEESQQRGLQLFANWTPPYEFKAHYARADGKGGIAIIESDTVEALVEGVAPWQPFFEFEVTPVMDIQQAVPALQRSFAWRNSVQ